MGITDTMWLCLSRWFLIKSFQAVGTIFPSRVYYLFNFRTKFRSPKRDKFSQVRLRQEATNNAVCLIFWGWNTITQVRDFTWRYYVDLKTVSLWILEKLSVITEEGFFLYELQQKNIVKQRFDTNFNFNCFRSPKRLWNWKPQIRDSTWRD